MFCIKCGTKVDAGFKFCQKCGSETNTPEVSNKAVDLYPLTEQSVVVPAKKTSIVKPVLLIGLVVAVAIIVIVLSNRADGFLSQFLDVNTILFNEQIELVRNGSLVAYPDQPLGKAFDSFFRNPRWEGGVGQGGQEFVNVSGRALYHERDVEMVIQFFVDMSDRTFEFNALEINGVPQSIFIFWGLLESIFR